MKLLKLFSVALTVLALQGLLAPERARSEPGGLHLNLTPFGGYAKWAKDVNLAGKPEFGFRAGLGFGRHLGVEGRGTFFAISVPGNRYDSPAPPPIERP